jgi:2,3-diaminopropionate biosynthesis protein SbnB
MAVRAVRLLNRRQVIGVLERAKPKLLQVIERAYVDYGKGKVVNPHSSFLVPPGPPVGRIIALPAGVFAADIAMGIKWISSFPANLERGLERASAVIILNDPETGYPMAILEGAVISAWRTALSACLACSKLDSKKSASTASIIGCGLIAARTLEALLDAGWTFSEINLFDIDPNRSRRLSKFFENCGLLIRIWETAEAAVARGKVVVFATTASSPWFRDADALAHEPIVLHLSLRDLDPTLILRSWNVVDDIEHATRAGTSLELACKQVGNSKFIDCDMHRLLTQRVDWRCDRPAIFSPFGLGMLDIAVANQLASMAAAEGLGLLINDFFDT